MKLNFNDYSEADLIRIIREWSGLTQKGFGELINKSERAIQDYEKGLYNYNIAVLKELCKKLNITVIFEKKK